MRNPTPYVMCQPKNMFGLDGNVLGHRFADFKKSLAFEPGSDRAGVGSASCQVGVFAVALEGMVLFQPKGSGKAT